MRVRGGGWGGADLAHLFSATWSCVGPRLHTHSRRHTVCVLYYSYTPSSTLEYANSFLGARSAAMGFKNPLLNGN